MNAYYLDFQKLQVMQKDSHFRKFYNHFLSVTPGVSKGFIFGRG